MASVGMRPTAHAFTSLLTLRSGSTSGGASAAAAACLLRQMVRPPPGAGEAAGEAGEADEAAAAAALELENSLGAAFGNYPPQVEDPADVKWLDSMLARQAPERWLSTAEGVVPPPPPPPPSLDMLLDSDSSLVERHRQLAMLDMLLAARLPPPAAAWARVLGGVGTRHDLREARRRVDRARSDGLMPVHEATYAALLRACARVSRHHSNRAPRPPVDTSAARLIPCSTSPIARCQAGDVPYAIEVLGLMDAAGTSPSEESLEHLLLACAQARRRARGARGVRGARRRAQGARGVRGARRRARGARGVRGARRRARGARGVRGARRRARGARGVRGARGARGVRGARGARGVRGARGARVHG
jgi:hypothetical protein